MSDYTITRVSSAEPRTWKDMEIYKVMVEGEDESVDVFRKAGDKPTVGEVLTGTIERGQYGNKFKKESKPYTPGAKGNYQPKDEAGIKGMWAIGQAIALLGPKSDVSEVEPLATDLFNMVDRVKTGQLSGYAKASATAQALKNKTAVKETWPDNEKINLDEIPF